MDLSEAIKIRHSVRSYSDRPIEGETEKELRSFIEQCNRESGLNIQLCSNEPKAFSTLMAHYGSFQNVKNYIALIGKKGDNLSETCGYYGEKIVLRATQLGLNTCWVALTFSRGKTACSIRNGEKLVCVIAIGYGSTKGASRKTKSIDQLCSTPADARPDWFIRGMEAVQLAPTAMNQQKFLFSLNGNVVAAKAMFGAYTKLDLGIAKYHFEIGAGPEGWEWEK